MNLQKLIDKDAWLKKQDLPWREHLDAAKITSKDGHTTWEQGTCQLSLWETPCDCIDCARIQSQDPNDPDFQGWVWHPLKTVPKVYCPLTKTWTGGTTMTGICINSFTEYCLGYENETSGGSFYRTWHLLGKLDAGLELDEYDYNWLKGLQVHFKVGKLVHHLCTLERVDALRHMIREQGLVLTMGDYAYLDVEDARLLANLGLKDPKFLHTIEEYRDALERPPIGAWDMLEEDAQPVYPKA